MKRFYEIFSFLILGWTLIYLSANARYIQKPVNERVSTSTNELMNHIDISLDNTDLIYLPVIRIPLPPPEPFKKSDPRNQEREIPHNLQLAWFGSPTVSSYQYCLDEVDDSICNTSWQPTPYTTVWITGLKDSTWYYWQVRALNAEGNITYADDGAWWSFQTLVYPKAGFWWDNYTGTYFFVTPDQSLVRKFSIYVLMPNCYEGWISYPNGDIQIFFASFITNGIFYTHGVFYSDTTASGDVSINNFPYCDSNWFGGLDWNTVWIDDSQPTSISPTAQKLISQHTRALPSQNYFLINPRK